MYLQKLPKNFVETEFGSFLNQFQPRHPLEICFTNCSDQPYLNILLFSLAPLASPPPSLPPSPNAFPLSPPPSPPSPTFPHSSRLPPAATQEPDGSPKEHLFADQCCPEEDLD